MGAFSFTFYLNMKKIYKKPGRRKKQEKEKECKIYPFVFFLLFFFLSFNYNVFYLKNKTKKQNV